MIHTCNDEGLEVPENHFAPAGPIMVDGIPIGSSVFFYRHPGTSVNASEEELLLCTHVRPLGTPP